MDGFYPSFLLRNGHFGTVWPTLFRTTKFDFARERITTPDNDFIDLDWSINQSSKLMIIGHGLEGSSNGTYVKGLAKNASDNGFDILAINWRGCSGEQNTKFESYHTGKSADLKVIIDHVLKNCSYSAIYYAGFSMGGNIGLKYAGEMNQQINPRIKAICAISTPVDLESSSLQLAKKKNKVYMFRFLRTLKKKYLEKIQLFPESELNTEKILQAKTFIEFDEYFTAPANGFLNAVDYWHKSSSLPYLKDIRVKTLILNAKNDPFLSPKCFPYQAVKFNPYLELQTPEYGGHVGFIQSIKNMEITWAEKQILEFCK
jgi:predicted alpha/beta-fold hydrolase